MKQAIFTILFFTVLGTISCKKTQVDIDIKTYDNNQIQEYIKANGLTGFQRDLTGGDTSGIYYKVILPGTGSQFKYTDTVSLVYSLKSFDGLYTSADTTINHYQGFVGHMSPSLPSGLQLMVKNVLKKGGSMRVLIPSRLAYGVKGLGSGSSSTANSRINGNQCLDYYVHSIDNQKAYDNQVIINYLAAKGFTGYQKTASGVYYKVLIPSTGTTPITDNTTIYINYAGSLLNGSIFDQYTLQNSTGASFEVPDVIAGLREILKNYSIGASVSTFIPSGLAYGRSSIGTSGPANSIIRFDFVIINTL
jgi:FKBP-type peptidyl-prolyl cis-trans isomerase FkpA